MRDYKKRDKTVYEHQLRIRDYLGLKRLDEDATEKLESFVFEECFRIERTASLLALSNDFLADHGILAPAESKVLRVIGEQRSKARERIHRRITEQLQAECMTALDSLLTVDDITRISALQSIKANPEKASPEAMVALVNKMSAIEATGVLDVDLDWLNANYQRAMFHYVRHCSVDRLRDLADPRRYAAMSCFLWQAYRDAVDHSVSMFDKLLTRIETQSKNERGERLKDKRRVIQQSLSVLKHLATAILDDNIPDSELRASVFGRVPKEHLEAQLEAITEWTDGKSSSHIHGIFDRFPYLRKFTPHLLRSVVFEAESQTDVVACLEGLEILQVLNEKKKRKLPEEATVDFVPARFRPFVGKDGPPKRRHWECSLLYSIRDELQSGNLSVRHSKRYGRFDDFFLTGVRVARNPR